METVRLIAEIIQTIAALLVVGAACYLSWDEFLKPKYMVWKEREENMMKRLSK